MQDWLKAGIWPTAPACSSCCGEDNSSFHSYRRWKRAYTYTYTHHAAVFREWEGGHQHSHANTLLPHNHNQGERTLLLSRACFRGATAAESFASMVWKRMVAERMSNVRHASSPSRARNNNRTECEGFGQNGCVE